MTIARLGLVAALALAAVACAPPQTRIASEVTWSRADPVAMAVAPGDIVRIEATRPIDVTSVLCGPQGEADVTTVLAPKDGLVYLRPALGTTALRLPPGTVAHIGTARDPEISWFRLEEEALAWARAPVGTPFPALAPAARLDLGPIGDLDSASAGVPAPALAAIRALVALRLVHALEGVRPYPYAKNTELSFPGESRKIQARDFTAIAAGKSVSVTVDGPGELALSTRIARSMADVVAELHVREGTSTRGDARAIVHHFAPDGDAGQKEKNGDTPTEQLLDPTLAMLRRVVVHVPPGRHTYAVEAEGAAAWVAGTFSVPYHRVEDAIAGTKDEMSLAAEAMAACPGQLCAAARVLGGNDRDAAYAAVLAKTPPAGERLAIALAAGAPADRTVRLESDAATGEKKAIVDAAREGAASVDPAVRDAWWRGTLRGTSWQTIDDGAPPTWFAFLPHDATSSQCAGHATSPERELEAQTVTAASEPWRRVRAVHFLAVAPCAGAPFQLEVNGQTLTAQPGSARTLWHVVVPGATATVRRLDRGAGKVYMLSDDACGGGTLLRPATPLDVPRSLAYPTGTTAPGVEVWLKQSTADAALTVTSGTETMKLTAHAGAGLSAIAEDGSRWTRAATVPLPSGWTSARVTGSPNVAVRAVARGVKPAETATTPMAHAKTPNVEALAFVSRKLLAARSDDERASAALYRGVLLASYGAERAALEDAERAAHWGKADAIATVRKALLPLAPTPLESATPAYGLEPDFDPGAPRCAANASGERARIAALDASLRARPKNASFDRTLALQAVTLANASPRDPRAETLVTLATAGSRWRLLREGEVEGGARVARPNERERSPILDSDGRLRARLVAGNPFGEKFVSVSPDRPARAFVADIGAANAHLDVVCAPRRIPAPGEKCPIDVKLGGMTLPASLGENGHGRLDLPKGRGRGKGAELNVTLAQAPADWVALIRVVLDAQAPGTTEVVGAGWVLDTPRVQYRFVVAPGRPIRVRPGAQGLVRLDALADTADASEVTASYGGHDVVLPTTGEPKILPSGNDVVTVSVRGGPATIAVAERVEADARFVPGDDAATPNRVIETSTARMWLGEGGWRDVAERSPRPLSWLADRLGTIELVTGALAGTLREGSPSNTATDAYAYQTLSYRRRVESLNLYALATGTVRLRGGDPTYGGGITFYEDLSALRLRLTGTLNAFSQKVGTASEQTLQPHAFLEYSGRLSPSFYILPRIGYDGYFTTLNARPASSKNVDDDIYNAFLFERNSFAFLQGLFWWVPLFNEITYVRARVAYDVTNGAFSHAALRPGAFVIVGPFEAGAYADGQYFERTLGARSSSGIDLSAGATVAIHLQSSPGSFEVRPTASGEARADGGWQVFGGLTFIASARRGVRDYSSLELSFPESTGGGIPWRTEGKNP